MLKHQGSVIFVNGGNVRKRCWGSHLFESKVARGQNCSVQVVQLLRWQDCIGFRLQVGPSVGFVSRNSGTPMSRVVVYASANIDVAEQPVVPY